MNRVLCFALSVVIALLLVSCEGSDAKTDEASADTSSEQYIVFPGSNSIVSYIGLSEAPGISGCLYLCILIL